MPRDLTDDKSTLVQVMAWCHQATSHYLSQCWLSSLSSCGIARPQWVNLKYWAFVINQISVYFFLNCSPHCFYASEIEAKCWTTLCKLIMILIDYNIIDFGFNLHKSLDLYFTKTKREISRQSVFKRLNFILFLNTSSWKKSYSLNKILLKFALSNNKLSLVQVMAWHRSWNLLLPEPVVTQLHGNFINRGPFYWHGLT